jgi:hypothetical protein
MVRHDWAIVRGTMPASIIAQRQNGIAAARPAHRSEYLEIGVITMHSVGVCARRQVPLEWRVGGEWVE